MARYSDNYYLRKCFLEREQVPTQSNMIKIMSPPLAKVYFKSMNYNIKVLAGLEPPMKGGGNDWYIPPKEILDNGKVVMKPVNNEHLKKLSSDGIGFFAGDIVKRHHQQMEQEKNQALADNDTKWKQAIDLSCQHAWNDASKLAAEENTKAIRQAFREFSDLYVVSINKIESLLFEAAAKDIKMMQDATQLKMQQHYAMLLDKQANMLYNSYTKKLNTEKARLKDNFVKAVDDANKVMINQIHNLNLEKHVAIEKLRQLLESMNLACQVYVTLKERNECRKEMDLAQHEHKKTVKKLQEKIMMKDFEIHLAKKKEQKRKELNTIWKKKICKVIKNFQLFVGYCLKTLPEHADFFIDIEKLLLLQLSEAMENPSASSIFVPEPDEDFHTPVPRPHPFYLCCDRGFKAQVDPSLCPKHCTSSASQLPVVIVNNRCIYAACDNFETFTDKVTRFVHGQVGDDIDFEDNHIYEHDYPFKMTSSQQLLQLNLESSLMQVLQKELPNIKKVPIECCVCRIPYCFCSPTHVSKLDLSIKEVAEEEQKSRLSIPSGTKIETRSVELLHEREPKWESYMRYVTPKCYCGKRAKKHLEEHLPAYMRNMSIFEEVELPHYEKCTVSTLRKLVRKAQGKRPPPPATKVESKTRDIGTQYSDHEWDTLCSCFSDDELKEFVLNIAKSASAKEAFKVVGDEDTPDHLTMETSTFAIDTGKSLKKILKQSPQLEEIFKATDCNIFYT